MQIRRNWLKKRILLPLSLATAGILALFLFGFQHVLTRVANAEFARDLAGTRSYWQNDLHHHASKLGATLAAIAHDEAVRALLAAGDRDALYAKTKALYTELRDDQDITYLGFLDAERRVVLRVHRPGSYGDRIECVAARKAEQTGSAHSSLAVEKSGAMYLRVVQPIRQGHTLIGYAIAAENLKHLLQHTDDLFQVRHLVLVDKERVDATEPWEAVPGEWDVYPRHAVLRQSIAQIPALLSDRLLKGDLAPLAEGIAVPTGGRDYFAGSFVLREGDEEPIGHLVVLRDVTDIRTGQRQQIITLGVLVLILSGVMFAFFHRITNQAEKALDRSYHEQAVSHERLKSAHQEWVDSFHSIREPIFLHDREFRVIQANRAYAERAGMALSDIIGRPYWEVFPRGEGPLSSCRRALDGEPGNPQEEELRLDTGEVFISRASFITDQKGAFRFSVHILEDITERERMAEALRRENRARKVVSESNHALIHARDETSLLNQIAAIITGTGAYRLAWVAYKEEKAGKPVRMVACSGVKESVLAPFMLTWADNENGRTPVGAAIRSGEPEVVQDIERDSQYGRFAELAHTIAVASVVAFPLRNGPNIFGALVIGAVQPHAFDDHEIALLSELAGDLAYGVTALRSGAARDRAEREHISTLRKLEASLDKTVEAMATAVEMRDPYTAGHQRRVAALAVAIAREMDLPDDQVDSIKVAGMVHDIGKLYCPAEILSKPGQLSAAEFELIKNHCQVGYDILRDIDFPWPVALMVLQHHERLDGSGYPNQLKGDDILLEARILAVADVVEAMSSHRPYRPALSDDAGVEEIARYGGERYDADVVRACVRLIRDKGYRLD